MEDGRSSSIWQCVEMQTNEWLRSSCDLWACNCNQHPRHHAAKFASDMSGVVLLMPHAHTFRTSRRLTVLSADWALLHVIPADLLPNRPAAPIVPWSSCGASYSIGCHCHGLLPACLCCQVGMTQVIEDPQIQVWLCICMMRSSSSPSTCIVLAFMYDRARVSSPGTGALPSGLMHYEILQ